jgi:hypothetical protein
MRAAFSNLARLSTLQEQILVLALENKQREHRGFDLAEGADLYYAEIFHGIYEFPMRKNYGGRGPREMPCCRIFAPGEIGRRRYAVAKAAISRAVLRLHRRDLVHWVKSQRSTWSGCNLTPAGVEVARQLQTGYLRTAITAQKA